MKHIANVSGGKDSTTTLLRLLELGRGWHMIKIIRMGKPQKGTIETFECIYCGCIWQASDEDVFAFADEKEIRCACYCPSCHEMAWIVKEFEESE